MTRSYSVWFEALFLNDEARGVFETIVSGSRAGFSFNGSLKQLFTKYFQDNIDAVEVVDGEVIFRVGSGKVDVSRGKAAYFSKFCMTLRRMADLFKYDGVRFTLEVVELENGRLENN